MLIRKPLRITLVVALLLAVALALLLNPPQEKPDGVRSVALYQEGDLGVVKRPFNVVDTRRPTPKNGDFAGSDQRELKGSLWMPARHAGVPHPLLVYSHGFMSMHNEGEYLARFLASHGYIVVSVDFPLTHYFAPGGPTVPDVVNQPEDVRFIIDTVLERSKKAGDDLYQTVDANRIAVAGLSLGGMTTELVTYHPMLRDPRISAAISLAGPSEMFRPAFFAATKIPFMMIAADADAMVYYDRNAAPMLQKNPGMTLVTLRQASHAGFSGIATIIFRWVNNPDQIGCEKLMENIPKTRNENFLVKLGGEQAGIDVDAGIMPCKSKDFVYSMRPAKQQMLTTLAAYSFLQSVFAPDSQQRAEFNDFLVTALPQENADITVKR